MKRKHWFLRLLGRLNCMLGWHEWCFIQFGGEECKSMQQECWNCGKLRVIHPRGGKGGSATVIGSGVAIGGQGGNG